MAKTHKWRVFGCETRLEDILKYEDEGFQTRKFPGGDVALMEVRQ